MSPRKAAITPEMLVRQLAPWEGGKSGRMQQRIQSELGRHDVYWDLCVGGCSTLFAKPRCRVESVVDLDASVCAFASILQDDDICPLLLESLDYTLPTGRAFDEAVAYLAAQRQEWGRVPEPGDPRSVRLRWALSQFIVWWAGRGGDAGTGRKPTKSVRYSPSGGTSAKRFDAARRSMHAWINRLRGVEILCMDAHVVLDRLIEQDHRGAFAPWASGRGCVIYIDPPYGAGGSNYATNEIDHRRLAEQLGAFRCARVVMSERTDGDRPLTCGALEDLYPTSRWRWVETELHKRSGHATRKAAKPSTIRELLIVNGPPVEEQA